MAAGRKKMWQWGSMGSLVACLGLLGCGGCATTGAKVPMPTEAMSPMPHAQLPDMIRNRVWSKRLPGYITDLSLSADGRALLVATQPNRDNPNGAKVYGLAWYGGGGKLKWQIQPDAPVRVQAIADDASMAVVSTYDEKIVAFSPTGHVLWKADALCRPILLTQSKKVVCYHDDDADPRVAFDVYDWAGKKLLSYSIVQDILALKVSDDETNLVLGMTEGQVVLFGPKFKNLWQSKVSGEILDLDVSNGSPQRVAVLHYAAEGKKTVTFLGVGGKIESSIDAPLFAQRLEFANEAHSLALFGGDAEGQDVAVYEMNGATVVEKWRRHERRQSDAPPQVLVSAKEVVLAAGAGQGVSEDPLRLISYSLDGQSRWAIALGPQLTSEEAAGLYAHSYAPQAHLAVVATDDGGLSAFQTERAPVAPPKAAALVKKAHKKHKNKSN